MSTGSTSAGCRNVDRVQTWVNRSTATSTRSVSWAKTLVQVEKDEQALGERPADMAGPELSQQSRRDSMELVTRQLSFEDLNSTKTVTRPRSFKEPEGVRLSTPPRWSILLRGGRGEGVSQQLLPPPKGGTVVQGTLEPRA